MATMPAGGGKPLAPMTKDEYDNKRSWLIDTAETPQDKKNLKVDLKNLNTEYRASNVNGYVNPVRQAGNSTSKVHPDNKPATRN
jgi:hypothetical protein